VAEPSGSLQEAKEWGLDREDLLQIYRNMLITRGVEERGHILYRQGKIPGSFYTGRGNEAASVGVATAMSAEDVGTPLHRDMGVHITRGVEPWRIFAQYMGRADGPTHGRDGNVHMADAPRADRDGQPLAGDAPRGGRLRARVGTRCPRTPRSSPLASSTPSGLAPTPTRSGRSKFDRQSPRHINDSGSVGRRPPPPAGRRRLLRASRSRSDTGSAWSRATPSPHAPSVGRRRSSSAKTPDLG
jgi:hypothetical protein